MEWLFRMKLNRIYFIFLFLLFFLTLPSKAEIDFNFNGYLYNMSIYQKLNDSYKELGFEIEKDNLLLNLSRLRIRPVLHFWDGGRLELHHETNLLFSDFSSPLLINPDKTNRQAVKLNWKLISNKSLILTHFIDRLYFKQSFENATLIIGRQNIAWGSGRIWQPTDLFNPINPANFSKFEKDGADAVSFKYSFGSFTDLELVCNLREKFSDYNFAGRFRTNFSEYDLAIMSGRFDKRIVLGGDFAGNFFGAGIRGEALFSSDESDISSNFVRFIFGLDYQFTSKLYCLIEYQFNGAGTTDKEKYDFERLFKCEIQNLNKNYVMASANYLIHPLVSLNLSLLSNLNDNSGYASLLSAYSIFENMNLRFGGIYFYGKEKTEYWYFSPSTYLLVEYYF
ncbi:MAG: hypothetical protein N2319_01160 [Candidatus Kapabacteria bacterium]|nr:hypothetical protein [Candidatus Kapabacteria bacterium]